MGRTARECRGAGGRRRRGGTDIGVTGSGNTAVGTTSSSGGTMKIEAVDFYYLSMPEVLDIGDGSQDLLLVRLQAGPYVGWGECEAAPLVSIASLVCPMSHSACKPVSHSVLGQQLETVEDIDRIGNLVRANSMDLLQTD